jgi:hypothetical protein
MRSSGIALSLAAFLLVQIASTANAQPRPPAPFFSPASVKICVDYTASGKCGSTPARVHAIIGNSNPPWKIVGTKRTCDLKIVAWLYNFVSFAGSVQNTPAGTGHCTAIDYSFAVPNTPYKAEAKLTVDYTVFLPNL